MEIRPGGESRPNPRNRPVARATAGEGGTKPQAGDGFTRQEAPDEDDTPFWLVCMSTDRLAGRQYLDRKAHQAGAKAEAAWVKELVLAGTPAARRFAAAGLPPLRGAAGLQAFQALVDGLVQGLAAPKVVWLPGMREGRGQYLFRVSGGLIQLRPAGPGDLAAWLETVAHETFHHLQQELVTALYKGDELAQPQLAAYYRDARAVYQPALPFEANRRQALEVGAWTFGADLARAALKG
ncbi:MAG: hypothetical protein JWM80_6025 [Cyanobacteria bacterium RYN_339]|nr:hypothetical protein [Cyanobacteria bacterium RYN_339]